MIDFFILPAPSLSGTFAGAPALAAPGTTACSLTSASAVAHSASTLGVRDSASRVTSSLASASPGSLALGACSISSWHIVHLPSFVFINPESDPEIMFLFPFFSFNIRSWMLEVHVLLKSFTACSSENSIELIRLRTMPPTASSAPAPAHAAKFIGAPFDLQGFSGDHGLRQDTAGIG